VAHTPEEILPGVLYWTAPHPIIHVEVSSYWLAAPGVLIDPLVPLEGGLDWFARQPREPTAIVLSNRHHSRESERFAERFGCSVLAPRSGMHEFAGRSLSPTPYDPGEQLPGGLIVHEIGSLCPDDMALHLPAARAVWFADGVVLGGPHGAENRLGFVPDSLMDDPPGTKRGLLAALATLLDEVEFEHVLCAHGGPLVDGGRAELEELVRIGGRTAFEW
jgi:hypothetical protein